jgi:hypothetical protein
LMPATTLSLHMPKDPASVALPALPSPVSSPVMAPNDIPPPIGDPPETGGLLFTTLSAPRTRRSKRGDGRGIPCLHP